MADAEPRVVTATVRVVLAKALSTYDADQGESVQLLAERAGTSSRTVYRVLGLQSIDISLDLADRLVLAAGGSLSDCTLVWADGRVE